MDCECGGYVSLFWHTCGLNFGLQFIVQNQPLGCKGSKVPKSRSEQKRSTLGEPSKLLQYWVPKSQGWLYFGWSFWRSPWIIFGMNILFVSLSWLIRLSSGIWRTAPTREHVFYILTSRFVIAFLWLSRYYPWYFWFNFSIEVGMHFDSFLDLL